MLGKLCETFRKPKNFKKSQKMEKIMNMEGLSCFEDERKQKKEME